MSEEPGRTQPRQGAVSTRSPFPVADTVAPLSAPATLAAKVAAS
jgi:hypothetical protein